MPDKYLVMVCVNDQFPAKGGCKDKGSQALFTSFCQKIKERNLEEKVEVKSSACLNNCRLGMSVKVFPSNILYSKVTEEDLDELIQSHFENDQPLKRLQQIRINRFLGF